MGQKWRIKGSIERRPHHHGWEGDQHDEGPKEFYDFTIEEVPPTATGATLQIKEKPPMSTASLTVDTADATAALSFEDDKGDTNAAAPAGLVALFSSDNEAAFTVANDVDNPLQGDITVVGEGTGNLGCVLTDANGNSPPLEADGVTPWALIDPVAVTVDPGAAVGAQLSVNA
jgi:hypothetical protein